MDRDTAQQTADDACVRPLDGRCVADGTSTRRPARGAWQIRAAVVAYVIANGIVAYLVFSTV